MAEYINKEEVLERCEALPKLYREAMRLFIKEIPSVNIVRCKECKYYEADWCYWRDEAITADDFCSYGEREGE